MGNDHALHHIKFDGEGPPGIGSRGHYSGYSAEEIKTMLEATNPRAIEDAGHAYSSAASTLRDTHLLIRQVAGELAQVWSGDASIEAQSALQLVHKTVNELATRCGELGQPLTHYGREVLPKYIEAAVSRPSMGFLDAVDFLPGDDIAVGKVGDMYLFSNKSTNDFAREDLMALNQELVNLYNQIPATVEKDLPQLSGAVTPPLTNQGYPGGNEGYPGGYPGGGYPGGYPGGGGYSGGGGYPGYSGGGYPGGSGGGYPGVGDYPGVSNPAYPGGPGTSVPGVPGSGDPGTGVPPGSGTVPPGYSTDPPGLNPNDPNPVLNPNDPNNPNPGLDPNDPRNTKLAGFEPTVPGGPGTGLGPGTGVGPGTGPGTGVGLPTYSGGGGGGAGPTSFGQNGPAGPSSWVGTGGTTGAGGGFGGAGALRADGRGMGMGGMPFMPMGGAAGEGNQDRERSTWLTEDEDIWGGEGGTAPPVIT